MKKNISKSFGFRLFEFVLVFFLVALLSLYVWFSINPFKIFADVRNIQRLNDLTQLYNAITQYHYENNSLPFNPNSIPNCSDGGVEISSDADGVDLASKLVNKYLIVMPFDPSIKSKSDTGYKICAHSKTTFELTAPLAEGDKVISVKY